LSWLYEKPLRCCPRRGCSFKKGIAFPTDKRREILTRYSLQYKRLLFVFLKSHQRCNTSLPPHATQKDRLRNPWVSGFCLANRTGSCIIAVGLMNETGSLVRLGQTGNSLSRKGESSVRMDLVDFLS
jgi:hypothetical protein